MAKRIKQDLELDRAQAGVETVGINGYIYKGGQFLPHTENKTEKLEKAKQKTYLSKKQQIEPYVWVLPPSYNVKAFLPLITNYIDWNIYYSSKQWKLRDWNKIGSLYRSFGNELTETEKNKIIGWFEKWVAGERWIER